MLAVIAMATLGILCSIAQGSLGKFNKVLTEAEVTSLSFTLGSSLVKTSAILHCDYTPPAIPLHTLNTLGVPKLSYACHVPQEANGSMGGISTA